MRDLRRFATAAWAAEIREGGADTPIASTPLGVPSDTDFAEQAAAELEARPLSGTTSGPLHSRWWRSCQPSRCMSCSTSHHSSWLVPGWQSSELYLVRRDCNRPLQVKAEVAQLEAEIRRPEQQDQDGTLPMTRAMLIAVDVEGLGPDERQTADWMEAQGGAVAYQPTTTTTMLASFRGTWESRCREPSERSLPGEVAASAGAVVGCEFIVRRRVARREPGEAVMRPRAQYGLGLLARGGVPLRELERGPEVDLRVGDVVGG